ncbi:hypothetical protein ACLMJK_006572 [Lecanora helva]
MATTTNPSSQQNPHSRSPSPAPSPPQTLTPGPRATLFSQVLSAALAKTIKACSYANFSACFPTPAKHADNILQVVWKQIVTGIEEKSKREFEEIMVEKDVVGGLNELERLVGMAKARKEAGGEGVLPAEPPHTLPPQSLYLAHLAPYLASTQTQFESQLEAVQADNAKLANGIEGQKDEIEKLVSGLEALIADIEGANVVMGDAVAGADIRKEAMEVENEIGDRPRNSRL